MSQPGQTHHAIDYIEIYVTDMAKAKEFYGAAFGWEFNDYGPGYSGIKRGNGESGGLCLEPSLVSPGGCLVILYSNDLEGSRESVLKAGGTIAKETFSFPGGRRFQFCDPFSNELAVWTVDAAES